VSWYDRFMSAALDSELMHDVIQAIESVMADAEFAFAVLNGLTTVSRFELTAMFLDKPDVAVLRRIFQRMTPKISQESVTALASKYCLDLKSS